MKVNKLFCALFLAAICLTTTTPLLAKDNEQVDWITHSEFVSPITSTSNESSYYIAVNEEAGIALLDDKGNVLSHIAIKAEHLDVRMFAAKSNTAMLVTLDKNTGHIVFLSADLSQNTLTKLLDYPVEDTAIDALCLGTTYYGLNLFTLNVFGEAAQLALNYQADQSLNIKEVTRFPVGPNVKSCAVSEQTQSLYITEENIGIWRYSTNPELEVIRQLYQLPADLEIEYVDTTTQGDIAVVSPSTNALWLLESTSQRFKAISLPDSMAPKTVQLSRIGSQLNARMFDDETEKNVHFSLSVPKPTFTDNSTGLQNLAPYAQTDPVDSFGDAADDPEIWVNQTQPEKSLVYGTDKKSGLDIYTLDGNRISSLKVGRVNNVDIRYDVTLNGQQIDLAAASNRTNKSISLFKIDRSSGLPELIADIKTDLTDPYGLCMSQHADKVAVYINDTDGRFQRYDLHLKNTITATKSLEWQVPSQPEGCVSDDNTQRLFYGEESTGVWLKTLNQNQPDTLITTPHVDIKPDIEGMSLYQLNGKQYLVVSSQGNNRYAVYAVDDDHQFLGVFEVGYNNQDNIDGASETDGLAVTSHSLGSQFPEGLLVVQDGHNVMPSARQNFKLVNGTQLKQWILDKTQHIN